MEAKVQGVMITLTEDQIAEIARQTNLKKFKTIKDVNSYEDACEVLSENANKDASCFDKMNTIIRAVNFIENGFKVWKPDWKNNREYKYFPYFEYKNNGWVVGSCYYFSYCTNSGFSCYMSEQSALFIAKKFINLYSECFNKF